MPPRSKPSSSDESRKYTGFYTETICGQPFFTFHQTSKTISLTFYLENYIAAVGKQNSTKELKLKPSGVTIHFINQYARLELTVNFENNAIPPIKRYFRYNVKRHTLDWTFLDNELSVDVEKLDMGFWERCFVDDAQMLHVKNLDVDWEVVRQKREGLLGCFMSLSDTVAHLSNYWREENLLHY